MTRLEAVLLVQSPSPFDMQRVRNAIRLAQRCRDARMSQTGDCHCVACVIDHAARTAFRHRVAPVSPSLPTSVCG